MSRLLVTGADGFVGRWLVQGAAAAGYDVVAAIGPHGAAADQWLDRRSANRVESIVADVTDTSGIEALAAVRADSVIHLAAVASGAAARRDPMQAWTVNAGATAALAEACANHGAPRFLLVSTGEVYGGNHREPIPESAPVLPSSPYAASKVGAEVAAMEVMRRTGLPVIIARPFPHTGPGQSDTYVVPALAARIAEAVREGTREVTVGNLTPVRDMLDVRDVVKAYLALIGRGVSGDTYNVASGEGHRLSDIFAQLARLIGADVVPVADRSLHRTADIETLIGDASHLRSGLQWAPTFTLERTLQDLVNAQAQ